MPTASRCLGFLIAVTVASACQAESFAPSPKPPVTRSRLTQDFYDIPIPAEAPSFLLHEPRGLVPGIIDLGVGLLSGDQPSTRAETHGSDMSNPRLDLSIGFNF